MRGLSENIIDGLVSAGVAKSAIDIAGSSGNKITRKSDGARFLVKEGNNMAQIHGEAASLRAISAAAPGLCPHVYLYKEYGSKAVMISDYFELQGSSKQSQRVLGRRIAQEMHHPDGKGRSPTGRFGFACATHCGDTEQDNTWEDDWLTFFRDRRLKVLLHRLSSRNSALLEAGRDICDRVCPLLLSDFEPAPIPVILHGDLWIGNTSSIERGRPVIYDPSSSYGHGEFDWGIARMFSGLSTAERAYYEIIPRSQPHHEERLKLYELYHHLNHALLFDSGYTRGAMTMMRELSAWADGRTSSSRTLTCR